MTTHLQRIHLPLTPSVPPSVQIPDAAKALLALADEQTDRARVAIRKADTLRRAARLLTNQANVL